MFLLYCPASLLVIVAVVGLTGRPAIFFGIIWRVWRPRSVFCVLFFVVCFLAMQRWTDAMCPARHKGLF